MAKQEALNEKQRMLLEAWDQLNSTVKLNIHLQEEVARRNGILLTSQKFFLKVQSWYWLFTS